MMRLLFGGDVMLGRGVNDKIHRLGPHVPLQSLKSTTESSDLFLVNLECAISSPIEYLGPPKAFIFRADPPAVHVLKESGVDLVSLANNHARDANEEGLRQTCEILETEGIRHAGAGKTIREARKPVILEKKGQRIGVLACCNHQADSAATADLPGIWFVDWGNREALNGLLHRVRRLAAEVSHVIVSLHWQPNWAPQVQPIYRGIAKELVDAGARIVWGHSPHHFQGVEWRSGSAVLYSCGDLLTDYAIDPDMRNDRQLLFRLSLGEKEILDVEAFPIELAYAKTIPAPPESRRWVIERFGKMCQELGTSIHPEGKGWVHVCAQKDIRLIHS